LKKIIKYFLSNVKSSKESLEQKSVLVDKPTLGIGNVVFSILLFKWMKIGFWGFLITSIGALIINLSIGLGIGQSLFGLVGIAILYGVLQIKKDNVPAWDNLD
jgi:hypothetical protein